MKCAHEHRFFIRPYSSSSPFSLLCCVCVFPCFVSSFSSVSLSLPLYSLLRCFQLWRLQSERKKYRQEFFDAWKSSGNFDVILTPVHVLPAVEHNTFKKISFTCSFTLVFNVLDLPAGVVPITTVDRERDAYTTPAVGILEKTARSAYNLKEQHGLPLGIQVVGQPFKDETVLRAMRIIERLVEFKATPNWTP